MRGKSARKAESKYLSRVRENATSVTCSNIRMLSLECPYEHSVMQQYSETIYVELSSRTTGSIYIVGDFEPAEYVHYYYC
jgi:hypothetical protein